MLFIEGGGRRTPPFCSQNIRGNPPHRDIAFLLRADHCPWHRHRLHDRGEDGRHLVQQARGVAGHSPAMTSHTGCVSVRRIDRIVFCPPARNELRFGLNATSCVEERKWEPDCPCYHGSRLPRFYSETSMRSTRWLNASHSRCQSIEVGTVRVIQNANAEHVKRRTPKHTDALVTVCRHNPFVVSIQIGCLFQWVLAIRFYSNVFD